MDEVEEKIDEGLQEVNALNQEIEETQKEIIFTMGSIGESRSKETGNHVKRVAEYCYILALHYGLDEEEGGYFCPGDGGWRRQKGNAQTS